MPPADEGDGAPPDGGTWDEFWRERPDEDDPEARISLQWLVRAALIVGVVMLVAGLVWAGVEGRQRQAPATPGPGTSRPADADPWSSPVPADPGGTQAPGDLDATQAPADPDSTRAAGERTQATTGREDAQAPERAQAPTGREGARAPADAATEGRAGGARPPVAAISPASVRLGERRTGTFKLTCTGECRVTSFSGSNGIAVSGNAFTVRAPASRPGCAGPPVTESGVITVDWTGTLTDGGESVEADGTLTMMVSWTVTLDRGALIPDTDGGGHWSNCPQQKGTR